MMWKQNLVVVPRTFVVLLNTFWSNYFCFIFSFCFYEYASSIVSVSHFTSSTAITQNNQTFSYRAFVSDYFDWLKGISFGTLLGDAKFGLCDKCKLLLNHLPFWRKKLSGSEFKGKLSFLKIACVGRHDFSNCFTCNVFYTNLRVYSLTITF